MQFSPYEDVLLIVLDRLCILIYIKGFTRRYGFGHIFLVVSSSCFVRIDEYDEGNRSLAISAIINSHLLNLENDLLFEVVY
jgi:hypothetical protein